MEIFTNHHRVSETTVKKLSRDRILYLSLCIMVLKDRSGHGKNWKLTHLNTKSCKAVTMMPDNYAKSRESFAHFQKLLKSRRLGMNIA